MSTRSSFDYTEKKTIVLAANNGYMEKVETTIKSILCHNHHCKFYILNDDFPAEWFLIMQKRLDLLSSEIVNVKLSEHPLADFHLPFEGLHYASYFRYYLAEYVEEGRALYLDSDIIVRGDISYLFNLDLADYPLAAVHNLAPQGFYEEGFNSGVLLINCQKWRAEQTAPKLLELTREHHLTAYGDQGILNMHFQDAWLPLPKEYNFMVGPDQMAHFHGNWDYYQQADREPIIVHFTAKKPWQHLNTNRYGKEWWFYYAIQWQDIQTRSYALQGGWSSLVVEQPYQTCILTYTADIPHLKELIQALPQVHFHIAAPTSFAPGIVDLQYYKNCSLYPNYNPFNLEEILQNVDFYLDINHGPELENILTKMTEKVLPIFAYEETAHRKELTNHLYAVENVQQLIEDLHTMFPKSDRN
ncbi:glycosyltransferase family 8 protein [Streptococcus suis]|nr:glycosyltransferase family 8 protein [Streptococcus suis]